MMTTEQRWDRGCYELSIQSIHHACCGASWNCIGVFSEPELQVLISGLDADLNVEDLKKYVVFEGGYSHSDWTVRLF